MPDEGWRMDQCKSCDYNNNKKNEINSWNNNDSSKNDRMLRQNIWNTEVLICLRFLIIQVLFQAPLIIFKQI